jgi:glycosyltransferase involved in cell wall biosynthesis
MSTAARLVSVVMPVFNGQKYIGAALESVLKQTYPHLEVLVVDDGSTDGSAAIAASYGSRVRVIRQRNQGSAAARNAGIGAASGDLVALLDADDAWVNSKLDKQIKYLNGFPRARIAYHRWAEWDGDPAVQARLDRETQGQAVAIDATDSGWIYHRLLTECIVHTSTVLAERSLLLEVGPFDTGLRRGQDYDFWLRASRLAEFHKLAATLSLYRIHHESITMGVPERNYAAEVIESALLRWGTTGPDGAAVDTTALRKTLERHWRTFGVAHLEHGNLKLAVDAAKRALGVAPWSTANWKFVARVLLNASLKRPPSTKRPS